MIQWLFYLVSMYNGMIIDFPSPFQSGCIVLNRIIMKIALTLEKSFRLDWPCIKMHGFWVSIKQIISIQMHYS